ncbi:MAG: GGDEF domain-containing protein [Endomicrobium sp.]|jgi:diguanylate cyclase (GGDEF)-like protein|nr:GGDEF domain-containing protein [Endomicrobium sp.]
MNKKILILLYVLLTLIFLFFIIPGKDSTIVWSSFVALAGLLYAYWYKKAVFIFSPIACAIALTFTREYPFSAFSACVIFLSLLPAPYYFYKKSRDMEKFLFKKNRELKLKYQTTLSKYRKVFYKRQKQEDNIDKIIRFYGMWKNLYMSISKDEYVEVILNSFDGQVGSRGRAFFEKTQSGWIILKSSGVFQNKDIANLPDLLNKDKSYGISSVLDINGCKVVYWFLKIGSNTLGCLIIATDKQYSDRFVEEGMIFAPQISLGFRRATLFEIMLHRSRRDGLTGLLLKRYFLQRLEFEIQRKKRYDYNFYILMLDLDSFKRVNDEDGHLVGDLALASIAKTVSDSARPGDLVGRYGGEEFIILMPIVNKKEVKDLSFKIKEAVKSLVFNENGKKFSITISIGVSADSREISNPDLLIKSADKALYEAKKQGKDKVVLYDDIKK